MRGTSGQRQPVAVHVIRVEITADQLWSDMVRRFLDHGLECSRHSEALIRV